MKRICLFAPSAVYSYFALPKTMRDYWTRPDSHADVEKGRSCTTHTLSNGDRYEGCREGQGTYTLPNGDRYEGEIYEGCREGQGTYSFSNGDKYVGGWHKGLREGYGTYTALTGYKYRGEWKNDKQQGYGICVYSNGDKYEGEWSKGRREGLGIYTSYNGHKYVGYWKQDFFGVLGDPNMYLDKKEIIYRNDKDSKSPPLKKKNAVILQSNYDEKKSFGPFEVSHVHPAKMLESAGYNTEIIRFDSSQELEEKIGKISQKIDFIWVRAHGKPSALHCGEEDFAKIDVIRHLFEKVSQEPFIWMEACLTGRKGGLAEQMVKEMCRLKINPTVIAPKEEVAFRALNHQKLTEGSLEGLLITPFSKGFKDVSRVLKC